VANVSHEINTLLTAIMSFVETIHDGRVDFPQDLRCFLGIIKRHINRLNTILNDLLTLLRLEYRDCIPAADLHELRIQDGLRTVLQVCHKRAEEKGISLDLDCPGDTAAIMDETLMDQAVIVAAASLAGICHACSSVFVVLTGHAVASWGYRAGPFHRQVHRAGPWRARQRSKHPRPRQHLHHSPAAQVGHRVPKGISTRNTTTALKSS